MRCGKPPFMPRAVQHEVFYAHAGKIEVGGFRHAKAVPES